MASVLMDGGQDLRMMSSVTVRFTEWKRGPGIVSASFPPLC